LHCRILPEQDSVIQKICPNRILLFLSADLTEAAESASVQTVLLLVILIRNNEKKIEY